MPMTFDEARVDTRLELHKLDPRGTEEEKRVRLANFIEAKFGDYVEGWEIRTGRPWDQMTPDEAHELITKWPHLVQNPGVLSRLSAR